MARQNARSPLRIAGLRKPTSAPEKSKRKRFLSWAAGIATVALTGFVTAYANNLGGLFSASTVASGSSRSPSSQNQVKIDTNNGQVAIGGTINNYGPTSTGAALSDDPRAQIVQLTGSWSEQGFADAIVDRDTRIVALYLKSGMTATTLHKGASAILFGFQGESTQNGDPVDLVKTFRAAGFKVDGKLQDSYLMGALTNNDFPLMFNTALAPKGYTGGYQGGTFVGSLLFWIVQRAAWAGPTDQDIQVIKYLVSQGADCKIPLSFLEYNGPIALAGTSPYKELLPMMQSCAK